MLTSVSLEEGATIQQAIDTVEKVESYYLVFFALAALYESWSIPLSVMLAVPVGILGAVAAAYLLGQSDDVSFAVGLLTTVGLARETPS